MKHLALGFALLWSTAPLYADLLAQDHERYVDRRPNPHMQYTRVPEQTSEDPTEKIIDILLSQGVAGIGLIVLGWWIKTSSAEARADRLKIEERVFDLVEKTNKTLGEYKGELENIGRELERIRGNTNA
jgi:hypothetical protein|tara:strand:- start:162 stop:548 length:387 start_codon:yes stop_codon:yes gene_type:complete